VTNTQTDRQTDRQSTQRATSVVTDRIYALYTGDAQNETVSKARCITAQRDTEINCKSFE